MSVKIYKPGGTILAEEAGQNTLSFTPGINDLWVSGNQVGFTAEVIANETRATIPTDRYWDIERKMEWWRTEIRSAGGDIWFGTIGCGAFAEDKTVKGVVVATPHGGGIVLAKVVIL